MKYKDFTSTGYGDLTGRTYNGNININIINLGLTSLKGAPKIVNGDFYCNYNKLASLKYSPEIINGNFDCSNNNLTSLKYCPEIVQGNFYCYRNNLTSLEFLPFIDLSKFESDFSKEEIIEELKSSRPELLL